MCHETDDEIERVPAQRPGERLWGWFRRLTPAQQRAIENECQANSWDDEKARLMAWAAKQRAKAPEIFALLRRSVPAERWAEVRDFLRTNTGLDCIRGAMDRDLWAEERDQDQEQESPW